MKLFFQSKSRSKQIRSVQFSSQKICTNIPSALISHGLNLEKFKVRQFKTNTGDLTLITRKYRNK